MFRSSKLRKGSGSVMPFVAVSLIVLVGMMGISTDLMRLFQCAHELEYAAQAAAIYGLSQATDLNGQYNQSLAPTNIANAIMAAGSASWNQAQSGPVSGIWSTPVTFNQSDIQFLNNPNPNDANDLFVQVTAQRTKGDGNALLEYFTPAFSTSFSTAAATTADAVKVVEVISQPASRIGSGAPSAAQGTTSAFLGCGAMPIAVSNREFLSLTTGTYAPGTVVTIDFTSSRSPAVLPGHVAGCFVNVAASANGGTYYGSAATPYDVQQLEGLLAYFGATGLQSAQPPAAVERGSALSAFDPAGACFQSAQQSLLTGLGSLALSNRYFIIPVLANDPVFNVNGLGAANLVVGFARLSPRAVQVTSGRISLQVALGESVPMRNASCLEGWSTTAFNTMSLLPQPVPPFTPRFLSDQATQSVSARPVGVVMAPAPSPRNLAVVASITGGAP